MLNIYLDTETTDINPGQICELSMIIEDNSNNNFVAAKNYFFKVDHVAPGAEDIHGFSVEKLAELSGGKAFSDYYQEILDILKDNCIVAHNEAFDEKFISTELWRCGISFVPAARQCTMEAFKPVLKIPARYKKYGPYKNPKLEEVISFLNIDSTKVDEYSRKLFKYDGSDYHDSRFDTTAMYIAVNVYRDILHGTTSWIESFCKKS